jgi:hypothetical protein
VFGVAGEKDTPLIPLRSSLQLETSRCAAANDGAMVVIRVATEQPEYHVGCPSASLIVIRP